MTFIQQVKDQLTRMSEAEKDLWILSQAKLLEESERQGFYMSLSGKKKIAYMPSWEEIEEFCRKVEDQVIYLEYETHYYEFDDDGRYMDDWKIWHNDPFAAMPFVDRVFRGCHDLLILDEYKMAADILEKVCSLEFYVVEAQDSEDCDFDSFFTLEDAEKEGMFSRKLVETGMDWVQSVICSADQENDCNLAGEIVRLLEHPVCRKIYPHMLLEDVFLEGKLPKALFLRMLNIIEAEMEEMEKIFNEKFSGTPYSREKWKFERELDRKKEIALNIRLKCVKAEEYNQEVMTLELSWRLMDELCRLLRHEDVISEQWEIGEMQKICDGLLKKAYLGEEEWKLRKKVLIDIVQHRYYEKYCCGERMSELSGRLCVRKEEFIAFADILNQNNSYQEKAAELYHQYGQDDKYINYLETHLWKQAKTYVNLMNCYRKRGDFEKARKVARQGLEQCRDNLTDLFIYLLIDARENGNMDDYKKLYASAKRRKGADIVKIDKTLKNRG